MDAAPKIYAVLVAGSNYYYNYRHQADVCHAYQILHRHGIPDENIVVMMYDDVANSDENPDKGHIINHPNGSDVYHGVPKDYIKDTVTPENFLKILNGEVPAGGSGKTLKYGPNDHVFVNFVDHGAPGLLAFPGDAPVLTVKDFQKTLKDLATKKKFKKMVLYIEACESGSMFENFPNNIEIFATTAANGEESSYACYYDDLRQTYLGDLYSVNWMEDSDRENIEKESLEAQFKVVRNETNLSHVQQFGQIDIANLPVGQFQGETNPAAQIVKKAPHNAVKSTDVPLKILERKIAKEHDMEKKITLITEMKAMLQNRRTFKTAMFEMAHAAASNYEQALRVTAKSRQITDLDCHDAVVKHFDNNCMRLGQNTYATRFVYMLVNMCEEKISAGKITAAIDKVCAPLKDANAGLYL